MNLYVNFQLTRKRNELLNDIRQLKKSNAISKYYTDENGQISIRVKESDKEKRKVTYFIKNNNDAPCTLTKLDIEAIISKS